MRNTWKGLIIGGLTGVGAGAILDLFGEAPDLPSGWPAGGCHDPDRHGPNQIGHDRWCDSDHEVDLGDQVKEIGEQVKEILHRLSDTETSDHAREAIERRPGRERSLRTR